MYKDARIEFIERITGEKPENIMEIGQQFRDIIMVAKKQGMQPDRIVETNISTFEVWAGRVIKEKPKSIREVMDAIKEVVNETYGDDGGYEWFKPAIPLDSPFPLEADLAVWARPGRNEGTVINIEAITRDERVLIARLKEFYVLPETMKRANAITDWYYLSPEVVLERA